MKQFVENINVNGTAAVVTLVDQEVEGLIECPACENIFTAEQKDIECPYCGCRFDAEVSPIYLVVPRMEITQNEEKETLVIFIELQQCKQYIKKGIT